MKKVLCLMIAFILMVPAFCVAEADAKPVIGISWSYAEQEEEYAEYYDCVIEAAGGTPLHLAQITFNGCEYADGMLTADMVEETGNLKAEYAEQIKACDFAQTNLEEAMAGVDGVFFVGGEDISPSLYAEPQPEANNGEAINATRDISDYLLMAYCIQNDIPVFAACRGEQMMGIVSGCQFVQDIPNYFAEQGAEYPDTHRMPPETPDRDYARHAIDIVDQDSLAYSIIGSDVLENVSSWHHQTIIGIEGTDLKVTASTTVNGITTIEGIEVPACTYCVGMQFHPENDVHIALSAGDTAACPCNYDICLGFFKGLVDAAASKLAVDEAA